MWLVGAGAVVAFTAPRPFEITGAAVFFLVFAVCCSVALWVFRARLWNVRIGTFVMMWLVVAAFLAFFSHRADQEPWGSALVNALVYSWPWAVMGARDHAAAGA